MGQKINILFTIPNFRTAGSRYVLLGIFQNLDRKRFQPFVLVEKFPESVPAVIPEAARLYLGMEPKGVKYLLALAALLKKHKIDILHSWDYKSGSMEALACRKAGVSYLFTKKNNAWSKRWFMKSLLASHIAYNNPEMKQRFFRSRLLSVKVSFIPHGVDTAIFKPLPVQKDASLFIIGSLGVLGPNKNQLFLLKALTRLPKHFKLLLYGKEDADYKELLKEYIRDHGLGERVSFKGHIENTEIPVGLSGMDALVLSSRNEGLPLSILEAMACGVPVLSSDAGGGARFILKGFEAACIFSLKNEMELVQQLLQLANPGNALKEQLINYGRARVQEAFTLSAEVASYTALYLKLKRSHGSIQ